MTRRNFPKIQRGSPHFETGYKHREHRSKKGKQKRDRSPGGKEHKREKEKLKYED